MATINQSTATNPNTGPLAGLNVIDFGHYYAGPMVGMILADQGANVIRICKPVGLRPSGATPAQVRELPEQQYRLFNRNKKILELDLKTDAGLATARELVANADVLIENFRPGVMKKLGLDYTSVKTNNPGLIYLSLPGFASNDKKRSGIQAWEGIINSAAGTYYNISTFRSNLNYPPVYTAAPHCSVYGAIHGAIAVMAALIARSEKGIGTVIEAPLVECGLSGFIWATNMDIKTPVSFGQLEPFDYSASDSAETQLDKLNRAAEEARESFGGVFGNYYRCADGKMIYIWVSAYKHMIERLLKVLDLDKKVKQEGYVNAGTWVTGLDNNISTFLPMSKERHQKLKRWVTDAFLSKTTTEWDALLKQASIPSTVFRSRQEWLELEPAQKSGILVPLDNGQSELTVPGRLTDISSSDTPVTEIPQYQEPETITAEQARESFVNHQQPYYQNQAEQKPLKKGDLLQGLKILDLNSVLAGPTSGHILAHYGAEVIKSDSADFRDPSGMIFALLEHNQGKRSIIVDTTTSPGQDLMKRLISQSDVVVHNILDTTAQRLGVSQKQLEKIKPGIVSAQMSAFGGSLRGNWEMRPGFDPIIQAATGLPAQYGTLDNPHIHNMALSADTMGGFSLAFSALLGVYNQRVTGKGTEARTSLARANCHYQLPWMIAENGNSDWGEAQGQLAVGENWWQRFYACSDGWLYVGTTDERAEALAKTVGANPKDNPRALEPVFAEYSCDHWQEKLAAENIASHRVLNFSNIVNEASLRQVSNDASDQTASGSFEMLSRANHPCGSNVVFKAPDHVRVGENFSWKLLTPAPRWGQDTRTILQELGYSDAEIAELIDIKAAHEFMPGMGSKEKYFFTG